MSGEHYCILGNWSCCNLQMRPKVDSMVYGGYCTADGKGKFTITAMEMHHRREMKIRSNSCPLNPPSTPEPFKILQDTVLFCKHPAGNCENLMFGIVVDDPMSTLTRVGYKCSLMKGPANVIRDFPGHFDTLSQGWREDAENYARESIQDTLKAPARCPLRSK